MGTGRGFAEARPSTWHDHRRCHDGHAGICPLGQHPGAASADGDLQLLRLHGRLAQELSAARGGGGRGLPSQERRGRPGRCDSPTSGRRHAPHARPRGLEAGPASQANATYLNATAPPSAASRSSRAAGRAIFTRGWGRADGDAGVEIKGVGREARAKVYARSRSCPTAAFPRWEAAPAAGGKTWLRCGTARRETRGREGDGLLRLPSP